MGDHSDFAHRDVKEWMLLKCDSFDRTSMSTFPRLSATRSVRTNKESAPGSLESGGRA